jgi:hypothetical protein
VTGAPPGGRPEPGRLRPRPARHRGADPRRPGKRAALLGLLLLALCVQVLVWGTAPSSGRGGALLPGLRPAFGVAYAGALVAVELLLCLWFRMADAAVGVLVTGAAVDLVFWSAHLAGARFALGGAASLTAASGMVALTAWVSWRRPAPRPPRGGSESAHGSSGART